MIEEEKRIRSVDSSISSSDMVKINLDFSQYHVKMLADVMEAIIGAIFLDCIWSSVSAQAKNKKDKNKDKEESKSSDEEEVKLDSSEEDINSDEEEKQESKDSTSEPMILIEKTWKNIFEDYLKTYADNPELPDKAKYYAKITKTPYCKYINENTDIVMWSLTKEDIEEIKYQGKLEKIIKEQVDKRAIDSTFIPNGPVLK